jgi:hypothetical protein
MTTNAEWQRMHEEALVWAARAETALAAMTRALDAERMRVAELVKKHAIDAVQQGDCGCNYAPCEHDDQRFRSARRVRELDLAALLKGAKP